MSSTASTGHASQLPRCACSGGAAEPARIDGARRPRRVSFMAWHGNAVLPPRMAIQSIVWRNVAPAHRAVVTIGASLPETRATSSPAARSCAFLSAPPRPRTATWFWAISAASFPIRPNRSAARRKSASAFPARCSSTMPGKPTGPPGSRRLSLQGSGGLSRALLPRLGRFRLHAAGEEGDLLFPGQWSRPNGSPP